MKNTKDYILLEAFKLFLEKGYDKVSMSELVSASGLSKGAFYHYFTGKEELFKESITSHFFAGLEDGIQKTKPGINLYESLKNIIDFKAQAYKQMLELNKNTNFLNLLFQAINMFPEFRENLKVANLMEEDMLAEIFRIAQEKGEIENTLHPKSLAKIYAAMLDGIELHAVVLDSLNKLHNEELTITKEFVKLLSRTD